MSEEARRADTGFLGHPRGLAILSFSEAWERFSYYGMQALLVLYMTQHLLLAGHVEQVWGFAPFRRLLEAAHGPLSPAALASNIFGLYAGLVYLTPIAGGLLADRVIGKTRAVTLGGLLMAAGHFLMAFEASFLPALLCLLIGVGCFKGNIASQVGDLYAPDDLRRADAFQVYMLGIQIAVIVSPLVCGTLGETVGWHWGFGAAGVGMLIGLLIYLGGRRWLPADPAPRAGRVAARAPLAREERRTIALLVALLPALALAALGNQQIFNAYLIWGESHYQLVLGGRTMPITWLISLDAFISTGCMAASVGFWRLWARRFPEPQEITKLAIGTLISAAGPALLAALSVSGHRASLGWAIAFHLLNDIGFANVFPVGLALYSRAAPRAIGGTIIAVHYLYLFAANLIVGWLGGLYETMGAARFWLIHCGLMLIAAAVLFGARIAFGRLLAPGARAGLTRRA
ncbi:peptide MFS transporter [Sphingomonas morindae]|uniref:Peptide MFS transporter n=1 Tax=Sphingomonas morindae TaxID=1541170 RepID=A0ABY4XAX9_9SPHN|nr:peptide MFS transporter [Sphingomonas morindae]USI74054.1 peptide MFS transporter [Sphingomonas morindae]